MSVIGYYRYKTIASEDEDVNLIVNGILTSTKTIKVVDSCADDILLKYLDSNGQYRFYPFNKFNRIYDEPDLIGTTNKFITNILTDQTNRQNIGYRNSRKMNITADVTADELVVLSDIYTSPRVYLYIGSNNSDTLADWLEVSINATDSVVKREKANSGRIDLIVTLPEHYTVKMI